MSSCAWTDANRVSPPGGAGRRRSRWDDAAPRVVIGIASGQSAVALGIAAAPIVSLAILPFVFARRLLRTRNGAPPRSGARRHRSSRSRRPSPTPSRLLPRAGDRIHGLGRPRDALRADVLNAGPLILRATQASGGTALAGLGFNVLLIARAPVQLFQAVQTSILPHLTRLRLRGATEHFRRSVTVTVYALAGRARSHS